MRVEEGVPSLGYGGQQLAQEATRELMALPRGVEEAVHVLEVVKARVVLTAGVAAERHVQDRQSQVVQEDREVRPGARQPQTRAARAGGLSPLLPERPGLGADLDPFEHAAEPAQEPRRPGHA